MARASLYINPSDPVIERIKREKGFAPKLAKVCGIGRTAPHAWKRVPAEHVATVGKFMRMAKHRIRPDLFSPQNG